ncbi:DMT family transporter [Shewanella sedimentimangrovi]|uniref:DMT family transporter n=1 Tax=Shewanella sedimentimangrovi TaxID=2814293 RepID=A0ABX7QXE9_9GAMM|nr:DMT family transporter [Shewanella sedimentimangrovi]QSX36194.1 DMT family transporter [Shewanella sedimentimangrovi]
MKLSSLLQLILLSAIWGASFLFMRIAVPELGPAWLMFGRVGMAALFLALTALTLKKSLHFGRYKGHYLMLGMFNSALPFLLYGYAATELPASLLSILNATAPLWGALISAFYLKHWPTGRALLGLVTGFAGVVLLAGVESLALSTDGLLALLAGLAAAVCYAIASIYSKQAKQTDAFGNAHGSMWAATAILLPSLWLVPAPVAMPSNGALLAVLALGVLCSGIAYLLYFRLVNTLGAMSALTVTFLIPVFGIFWGALLLDEHIGWHTLSGTAIILLGTALTTGIRLPSLFKPKLSRSS